MLVYSFETSEKEKVYLNAGVIDIMSDSLKFLKTSDKLKIKKNKGLFFKGSTYIEKENISKLKKIVSSWKGLFSEATQNFVLIGFFNTKIDGCERWNCNKEEVIESFEKLIIFCEKAEKENKIIAAMLIIAEYVGATEDEFLQVHHEKWLKNMNERTKEDYELM